MPKSREPNTSYKELPQWTSKKKLTSSNTIINVQKIEQVIIISNKINYLTSDNKSASLQTIDIPVDENINLNYIKHIPNLQLKTINDLEIDH